MIKFEKVSLNQYLKDRLLMEQMYSKDIEENARLQIIEKCTKEWENIQLPKRSTHNSAGYDFFAPFDIDIYAPIISNSGNEQRDWRLFPTGIRFVTDRDDIFLMCVPRSGLGFKYMTKLANTVGIIDSDYFCSDNEGHIMAKLSADRATSIKAGKAFMQGIIMSFLTVDNDNTDRHRNGGFGSTDTEEKKNI